MDPTHLNRDGTVALSRAVASFLRDDLGPGADQPPKSKRWVRLAAYRKAGDEIGLEDVEQTKARIALERRIAKGADIR